MTDRDILAAVCRTNLPSFIEWSFNQLNPGTQYLPNWHIDALAYHLVRVFRGELRRLIISMPPRHLKSICTSVALPAWLLGHFPNLKIICASYANELSFKHGDDTRLLMQSPGYAEIFPALALNRRRVSAQEIQTTARGFRLSTSVGGTLTGLGGDIVILDDMMKVGEAQSAAVRRTTIDWLDNTLLTRLDNQTTGAIILVMQRLHVDDLVGHLIERGGWEVLSLPLIAEDDFAYELGNGRVYRRPKGEILHPGLMNQETIQELRRSLGTAGFSAQYQQRPIPAEGNLIRREWLVFDDHPPETFDQVVQSWDFASGIEATHDFSVCTTWGIKGNQLYLLDVLRRKLPFPTLIRTVAAYAQRFRAARVLVERQGIGIPVIQQVRDDLRRFAIVPLTPKDDKQTRVEACSALIEAGRVHLPSEAPWLADFLDEVLGFPSARHDDQVDSLSQFLRWVMLREQQQRARVRRPGTRLNLPAYERVRSDPFAQMRNPRWRF